LQRSLLFLLCTLWASATVTLELHYWFSSETCGGVENLAERFVDVLGSSTENAPASCIPASMDSDADRLPAQLSVRWDAASCDSGGLLQMWQSRDCTGKVLANETVPSGMQGGKCINYSPAQSSKTLCTATRPPGSVTSSSPVGAIVASALVASIAVACSVWAYRKKQASGSVAKHNSDSDSDYAALDDPDRESLTESPKKGSRFPFVSK
jgi:hypothetical protein